MRPTAGERAMWSLLRFQAPGWTREYATGRYRLDFYCPAARLAVEVDGITHHGRQAQDRDRARDAWHADRGILTLRFSGLDVMRNRASVAAQIGLSVRQRVPEAVTPKACRHFLWLVMTGRRPVPAGQPAIEQFGPEPLHVRDERLAAGIKRVGRIPPRS